MHMRRPKFGSLLVAAALATAGAIPLFAAPAFAANTCDGGMFPATFAAQSGLKTDCHTDAGTNANNIEIHDYAAASWHSGVAKTVTLHPSSGNATTANNATIHFAAGSVQTRDIRHPISAFTSANATIFKGGTFIRSVSPTNCTTTCTSAVLSQTASVSATTVTAKIELTTNRTLSDAVCTAGTNTLTSSTGTFASSDVGKSVSGTPFDAGTFITSVSGTTATMNQTHSEACIAGRLTTIGGTTFSGGNPVMFNGDPQSIQLSNTGGGGQGFTCASGSHTLAMTAAAKANTGGFVSSEAGVAVHIKGSTTVGTTVSAVSTAGNTSLTLVGTCPAGVGTATGSAWIGVPGASAPKNNAPMMTLAAELNLNPVLVSTQDSCDLNTFEGFEVVGGWVNPGSYASNTSTPLVSVSQVLFPTSVISFNGFVVPKAGGDTSDANPHYDFSFPLLPTSLAVCLTAGSPANAIQLAFGMNATTESSAPFLPTGSGNPGDPPIRQLLPETGSFTQTVQLILNPSTVVATSTSTSCTISSDTTSPGLPCGDG